MWSDVDSSFVLPGARVPSNSIDNGIAGAQIGIQHQFSNVVLGVEASWVGTFGGFSDREAFPTIPFARDAKIDDIFSVGPASVSLPASGCPT